ncbi:MAG TPA: RES family NAD+ phosphorylase [Pseudoduganella sp.]
MVKHGGEKDPTTVTGPATLASSASGAVRRLDVTPVSLPAGAELHRVHPEEYGATQFNPGPKGNARFSPINDLNGLSIPTIYAGQSFECAAMETVFHDVSYAPGLKAYPKSKLAGHVHSTLQTEQAFRLADLGTKSLRKLGIQRSQLIDTEKDKYPYTRSVAEAIHAQHPDIQGLRWTSRQDDSAYAYMFFGDRIDGSAIAQVGTSRNITKDAKAYEDTLDLAEKIGVDVVMAS